MLMLLQRVQCRAGPLVFGGELRANWLHSWAMLDGQVLDLTDGVDCTAYVRGRAFERRREFRDKLESCLPRVRRWLREFRIRAQED
jgi:hypothetical protein